MTVRSLRRWAFLATLVVAVTVGGILAVRLALSGPEPLIASMMVGVFGVLLALAGIYPPRPR